MGVQPLPQTKPPGNLHSATEQLVQLSEKPPGAEKDPQMTTDDFGLIIDRVHLYGFQFEHIVMKDSPTTCTCAVVVYLLFICDGNNMYMCSCCLSVMVTTCTCAVVVYL